MTFRLRAGDDATRALMDRVNASGRMYLTHTLVNGQVALRLAIGATLTERRHVEAAWDSAQSRMTDADHALLHDADQMLARPGVKNRPVASPRLPDRGR